MCCALIVLAIVSSPAQGNILDELVASYSFDGTLADRLGANNGTMNAGSPDYQPGQFGQGIDLPGNQHVILPEDDADFDFAASGGELTISAWFRVDAFDKDWQALVAKGETNKYRVARRSNGNELAYAGSGDGSDINGAINVNDGKWHNIIAITTNAGRDAYMYIDGIADGSILGQAGVADNDANLLIGENPEATSRQWNGMIDEVNIWGRAITADEIAWLQTNAVPEPSGLVLTAVGLLGLFGWRHRR